MEPKGLLEEVRVAMQQYRKTLAPGIYHNGQEHPYQAAKRIGRG